MKPFKRTERVSSLVKRELASILQRHSAELQLPIVTITYVEVSRDLAHAKVFITLLQQEKLEEALKVLNDASGFIQHLLAKAVKLRITPKPLFLYDESISRGRRVSELIDKVTKEQ